MNRPIKEWVLQSISSLPDDATLDDIIHIVEMFKLLRRAREECAAGLGIASDEARQRLGLFP